jgi:hypothetical protein
MEVFMENVLAIRPPLSELYKFIDKIPRYPVSNSELLELASRIKAPKEVVDFYKSFGDRKYGSKDELSTVSEQVDLIRQEEPEMPAEIERSPEDY